MTDPNTERWERFCLVGMGNHARTKLVPAIAANGQQLVGIVSRRDATAFPGVPVFDRIERALGAMPECDVVVIASPPSVHYAQCLAAATSGMDVIVEKPAFVTADEARRVRDAASLSGSLVVEALMHRHTHLYARLLQVWRERRRTITQVSATFLIPKMPDGTFRQAPDIASSTLYDIGCYTLSLFLDLGLDPAALSIRNVRFPGDPMREALDLEGSAHGVSMIAEIGVGSTYANRAELLFNDGETVIFEPLFFGRPGPRHIRHYSPGGLAEESIEEEDAFRTMLSQSLQVHRRDEDAAWSRLISATEQLERLGSELLSRRKTWT